MSRKLTPEQVQKLWELRQQEEPVTVANLAARFGVSQRTIYYYLASYRRAAEGVVISARITES